MTSKRRANGEGSIYQRRDGRWVASFPLGKTHDGKRQRIVRYAKTKKEAVRELNKIRSEALDGPVLLNEQVTLSDWCKQWLEDSAPLTASEATLADYRYSLERWVLPHIGHIRVRELRPNDCARFQTILLKNGLSPTTVRHARRPLSAALTYAVRSNLIRSSPLTSIPQPKIVRDPNSKPSTLTEDEMEALVQACEGIGGNLGAIIVLTLYRGLRRSEVLGLHWDDIDFDKRTIHVQRRLREERRYGKDGKYYVEILFGPPKTLKSNRKISLNAIIERNLKRVKALQNTWRLQAGPEWETNGCVFTTELGKPLYPSNVYNRYKKVLRDNDLPPISFHDLRRTFTTRGIEVGVRIEEAQEALGHESIETTKNIYAHHTSNIGFKAFEQFDASFNGSGRHLRTIQDGKGTQ